MPTNRCRAMAEVVCLDFLLACVFCRCSFLIQDCDPTACQTFVLTEGRASGGRLGGAVGSMSRLRSSLSWPAMIL